MSVLAIGANDVTEAQQAAKDLLSNKGVYQRLYNV